jgi:hypothetical protein
VVVIGIDPGLRGALARLYGPEARVERTPTVKVGKRTMYDPRQMARLLASLLPIMGEPVHFAIERQGAMPKQGVSSTFKIGEGFGLWVGMVAYSGHPYEIVEPRRWKAAMLDGLPHAGKEGKGAAILQANRLFPHVELIYAKDHDKAEALLIAEYARRRLPDPARPLTSILGHPRASGGG